MAEQRLTDEEVALVLRRASELDVDGAAARQTGGGLPIAAVEAAAAEVGLSPAAVRQAVAELRAGAFDAEGYPIVCARVVPMACPDAVEAVGRWLSGQAMVCARDRATEQVWRPREDWVAGVRRALDWAAALRLKGVDEVVVRGVEVEGGTLLRLCARFERSIDAAPGIGAGVGGGVGGIGAAAAGAAISGELTLLTATSTAAAGAAAVGYLGWRLGRTSRANRWHRATEAIEGVLDELEHGRVPGWRTSVERLAERARRMRGGYRL